MKEASEPEEDTGTRLSPDAAAATASMAPNPEERRALKRGCSFQDEEQRPSKISRASNPTSEQTALRIELSDGNCELPTASAPVAGCSKDDGVHPSKSEELVKPVQEPASQSVDNESSNNDADEDLILPVELMSLSDDVLLIIMSNLKPTDLLNLSLCCQRLGQVVGDWSLWIDVDFRPNSLLAGQLERFLPFLDDTTERIATRGFVGSKPLPRWRTECLTAELLSAIARESPYLRSFIAEEHCIDANKIKISAFPSSIEHLSLKACEIMNPPTDSSYFNSIFRHLPHLKVLELSDCMWLPPHSIMALSKLPQLEELHLDGCYLIKDCIAYASLAFNLGFPKLKILDLRRTGVSDSELSCLNRSNRLTHLYLEYPHNHGVSNDNNGEPGGPRACHLPGIISDLGLRSLVISDKPHVLFNNAQFGINSEEIHVMAPLKDRVSSCKLHTLVARNFNLVTDATLNELHFAQSLRYLDLKGTQITRYGVEVFRSSRPDVTLITSYDDDFT